MDRQRGAALNPDPCPPLSSPPDLLAQQHKPPYLSCRCVRIPQPPPRGGMALDVPQTSTQALPAAQPSPQRPAAAAPAAPGAAPPPRPPLGPAPAAARCAPRRTASWLSPAPAPRPVGWGRQPLEQLLRHTARPALARWVFKLRMPTFTRHNTSPIQQQLSTHLLLALGGGQLLTRPLGLGVRLPLRRLRLRHPAPRLVQLPLALANLRGAGKGTHEKENE